MRQKRNRDRVMAEITPFHLMRLASERGSSLSREQAIALLNQECAQRMWQHMMQAGLDFIACTLSGDTADSKEVPAFAANTNPLPDTQDLERACANT